MLSISISSLISLEMEYLIYLVIKYVKANWHLWFVEGILVHKVSVRLIDTLQDSLLVRVRFVWHQDEFNACKCLETMKAEGIALHRLNAVKQVASHEGSIRVLAWLLFLCESDKRNLQGFERKWSALCGRWKRVEWYRWKRTWVCLSWSAEWHCLTYFVKHKGPVLVHNKDSEVHF